MISEFGFFYAGDVAFELQLISFIAAGDGI